jgi:very-short-patch-repair endonuclease
MKKDQGKDKPDNLGDQYLYTLNYGSYPSTHQNAKRLRRDTTEAEKKLWSLLRNRQLNGKKFRRQHPFADYVLDFFCNECNLAIELDGEHHKQADNKEYDIQRTSFLNKNGITVLRFWNQQVIDEPGKVISKILIHLCK